MICIRISEVKATVYNRPQQLLAVLTADGIEPLMRLAARRDTPEMLEVLSLALANLSANNPNNCRYDSAHREAPQRKCSMDADWLTWSLSYKN